MLEGGKLKRDKRSVIILGGGAAGMMAAIAAARKGARVRILERMQRVGKKILATGNGRCNYTNTNLTLAAYHGADPHFAEDALRQFDLPRTLAFFQELGIAPMVEPGGKVYPASGQAASVLDVLRYELESLGVEVACETNVDRVTRARDGGFQCHATDGRLFPAERVILAAGGKASPNLGSNGGGFRIAEALGHRVEPLYPTLVQVRLDAPFLKQLQGVKFNGEAAVWVRGQRRRAEQGEILFAEYGVSGIPILQLSRIVSIGTAQGQSVFLSLNLFPEQDADALAALLRERIRSNPRKPTDFSFVGLLHKRLIPVILKAAGIEALQRPCGELQDAEIRRIAAVLHDWRIPCVGTQSWIHAQVTAGGVSCAQVDGKSMESRLAPGFYFAGEVLDIDGDSGGYNLQWAWSSGFIAGEHAAL